MSGLSLREAAKEANVSKSTILRAVRNGRLSAASTDAGGYSIDPSELFRVYEPRTVASTTERSEGHRATTAVLEERIEGLKALTDELRDRVRDLTEQRDQAQARASELDRRLLTHQAPPRWFWWRRAIA
jgi:excisionase family DNA binding protein